MSETNETSEPSGASGGYGDAMSLGFGFFIAAAFIFCIVVATTLLSGGMVSDERPKPSPKPKEVVTVCGGCGSEWYSYDGKPAEPITKCPNCPMSEEEFEALKEQMRKRTEKP